jgi:hypothetical protein
MKKRVFILIFLVLAMLASGASASMNQEEGRLREAFHTAAFRAEYDYEWMDVLRRWESPLLISITGDTTREDIAGLTEFIGQLNEQVAGLPAVSLTDNSHEANITITLAPLDQLGKIVESYVPGNWGFFYFWYNSGYVIDAANIVIASDVTSQAERDHLIREEIVGAIGLPNDLEHEKDSIICQDWTSTRELSGLDWKLLNLAYDSRLSPGMSWAEAEWALGW